MNKRQNNKTEEIVLNLGFCSFKRLNDLAEITASLIELFLVIHYISDHI